MRISPDGSYWEIEVNRSYFEKMQDKLDDLYSSEKIKEPLYIFSSLVVYGFQSPPLLVLASIYCMKDHVGSFLTREERKHGHVKTLKE